LISIISPGYLCKFYSSLYSGENGNPDRKDRGYASPKGLRLDHYLDGTGVLKLHFEGFGGQIQGEPMGDQGFGGNLAVLEKLDRCRS
jgi:hypothetical protein